MSRLVVLPLLLAPLVIAGCGNEYHPEYHPVTVTTYKQSVAYPAMGPAGGPPPSIVFSAPPPRPPPTPWSAWPDQ